jgi:hypothetical protein
LNARLVICLIASIPTGLALGGLSLAAGWGWLVGFLAYSFGASLTLVVTTMLAAAIASPARRSAPPEVSRTAKASRLVAY